MHIIQILIDSEWVDTSCHTALVDAENQLIINVVNGTAEENMRIKEEEDE